MQVRIAANPPINRYHADPPISGSQGAIVIGSFLPGDSLALLIRASDANPGDGRRAGTGICSQNHLAITASGSRLVRTANTCQQNRDDQQQSRNPLPKTLCRSQNIQLCSPFLNGVELVRCVC